MKHKRDFKALEKRRLKGAKLLARGVSKSEVARQLGVTRQTVAAWEQRLDEGGQDSLKRGTLGRPRQLDAEQERELGKLLMDGALAAGYSTESDIARWKRHTWPALKKKPSAKGAPSSS